MEVFDGFQGWQELKKGISGPGTAATSLLESFEAPPGTPELSIEVLEACHAV